jgi:RNA polymerase sigma-70 factor (ECF subfamily)
MTQGTSRSAEDRELSDEIRLLVQRCRAGDEASVAALVERFAGRVYGLCLRLVGNRHDAEDLSQETFVRVLRSLGHWDPTRAFEPWLLAIAGNRCRTLLARRWRQPRLAALPDDVADRAGGSDSAELLAEEVHLALAALKAEHRKAFLLFHEQELSYVEIAAALDCPVGTAKTWVHRARRELAQRLVQRGWHEEARDAVRSV